MRPPSPLYVPQPGGVLVRGLRAPSAPPPFALVRISIVFFRIKIFPSITNFNYGNLTEIKLISDQKDAFNRWFNNSPEGVTEKRPMLVLFSCHFIHKCVWQKQ